jgi:hypothetical protein
MTATTERIRTFSWSDPAAMAANGLAKSGLEYLNEIAAGVGRRRLVVTPHLSGGHVIVV